MQTLINLRTPMLPDRMEIVPQDIGRVTFNWINNAPMQCPWKRSSKLASQANNYQCPNYKPTVGLYQKIGKKGGEIRIPVIMEYGIRPDSKQRFSSHSSLPNKPGKGTGFLGIINELWIITKGHSGPIFSGGKVYQGKTQNLLLF